MHFFQFLLLIMTAVMCSKWTGDAFTHPLYHALLELKCIPFLERDPVLTRPDPATGAPARADMELHSAADVMSSPAVTLGEQGTAAAAARALRDTGHAAFPVVGPAGRLEGLVSRPELTLSLLRLHEGADPADQSVHRPRVTYEEVGQFAEGGKTRWSPDVKQALDRFASDSSGLRLDLRDLTSRSAVAVGERHSLARTYDLFRGLGLRHLVVTRSGEGEEAVEVAGVITRKDLMGFAMEDRISGRELVQAEDAVA